MPPYTRHASSSTCVPYLQAGKAGGQSAPAVAAGRGEQQARRASGKQRAAGGGGSKQRAAGGMRQQAAGGRRQAAASAGSLAHVLLLVKARELPKELSTWVWAAKCITVSTPSESSTYCSSEGWALLRG